MWLNSQEVKASILNYTFSPPSSLLVTSKQASLLDFNSSLKSHWGPWCTLSNTSFPFLHSCMRFVLAGNWPTYCCCEESAAWITPWKKHRHAWMLTFLPKKKRPMELGGRGVVISITFPAKQCRTFFREKAFFLGEVFPTDSDKIKDKEASMMHCWLSDYLLDLSRMNVCGIDILLPR